MPSVLSSMQTVWILGDQLSPSNAALAKANTRDTVVLMVESRARGGHLRYHQHKLVLVFSAMRHFAHELESQGWRVDYHRLEDTPTFEDGLKKHLAAFPVQRIVMAEPNDWLMSETLPKLARRLNIPIETLPTKQFLCPRSEFKEWAGNSSHLLMERHYRRMREKTGYLMENGKPVGGTWNFDSANRHTIKDWEKAGRPSANRPHQKPDAITREVIETVSKHFPDHPGNAADFWLPVTRADSLQWAEHFFRERLDRFGPYEDLMVESDPLLFHSVLSPMMNLGLLEPGELCERALEAWKEGTIPLPSIEGFIRQIIGWREFINGVYWLRMPGYTALNELDADQPLPAWFQTGETDMHCLHTVIKQTLNTGFNHHIQRLMVLGNFFLIAGIKPSEAYRWFLEMYVDAHDWVMAANVIGMVLHADGGFMATKPYAAGSGYISKMSDYCRSCRFKPAVKTGPEACPFNYLYWSFYDRHADRFARNPRTSMAVNTWKKKSPAEQTAIRTSSATFLQQNAP